MAPDAMLWATVALALRPPGRVDSARDPSWRGAERTRAPRDAAGHATPQVQNLCPRVVRRGTSAGGSGYEDYPGRSGRRSIFGEGSIFGEERVMRASTVLMSLPLSLVLLASGHAHEVRTGADAFCPWQGTAPVISRPLRPAALPPTNTS